MTYGQDNRGYESHNDRTGRHDVYRVPEDVPVHKDYVTYAISGAAQVKKTPNNRKCGVCAGAVTGVLIVLLLFTGVVLVALYFTGVIDFGQTDKLNGTTTRAPVTSAGGQTFTSTSQTPHSSSSPTSPGGSTYKVTEPPDTTTHYSPTTSEVGGSTLHSRDVTTGGGTITTQRPSTPAVTTEGIPTSHVPSTNLPSTAESVSTNIPTTDTPSTAVTTPGWTWPHDPFANRSAAAAPPVRCQLLTTPLCLSLWSYDSVGFPSTSGMTNQDEANLNVVTSTFINDTGCYPYVMHWACASAFTECRDDKLIHPCRSFCEEYQQRCDVAIRCDGYPNDDDPRTCRSSPEGPPRVETRIPYTNPCAADEFLCGNGRCVAHSVVCDGVDDCLDLSDEIYNSTGGACGEGHVLDCNFESGSVCAWTQPTDDQFDWETLSGQSMSHRTGPYGDHTHRATGNTGNYLLADASGHAPLESARLVSPLVTLAEVSCLRFYYHMYGEDVDQLRVYTETSDMTSLTWQRRRDHDDIWRAAFVQLPVGDVTIHMEMTRGVSFRSDVAIDEVTLRPGACPEVTCDDDQFTCGNGHCLSEKHVCDRTNDCGDFTDEMNCECTREEFRCDMGLCVKSYFLCDKQYDCPDNSDEADCPCDYGRWACDDGKCIMSEWICDGDKDCPGGEDEAACGECGSSEFQCRDFTCVTESLVCDGRSDCSDGKDEESCYSQGTDDVIEVTRQAMQLPLCADGVTKADSDVICRSLGYGPTLVLDNVTLALDAYMTLDGDAEVDGSLLSRLKNSSSCPGNQVVRLECVPIECGTRSPDLASARVINGEDAELGRWPWQATLYVMEGLNPRVKCGGSLVSDSHVITAAHCFDTGQEFRVVVGDVNADFYQDNANELRQVRNVLRVLRHPDYSALTYFRGYDVAMVVLDGAVEFNHYVRPICLPEAPIPLTSTCYSAGLGYTSVVFDTNGQSAGVLPDKLQEVKLQMWTDEMCKSSYYYASNRLICAGYRSGFLSTCLGDSGGPLMCENSHGRWELAGVFSFVARGCDVPELPPVFGNVTAMLPWIHDDGLECVYRCGSGECLWVTEQLCDGIDHCVDGSDEITECDLSVTCGFDDIFSCGYRSEEGSSEFNKWIRRTGSLTNNVGPVTDRESISNTGGYMLAGTDATLLSPAYNTSAPSCMTFWYHMRGSQPGSLQVSAKGDNPAQLPAISGMSGDLWMFRSMDVPAGSGRVAFQATGSNGGAPSIALDDVTFLDGACSERACAGNEHSCGATYQCIPESEACNFHIRCLDVSDEMGCTAKSEYQCNFNTWYTCGLEQDSYYTTDNYDWGLSRGALGLPLFDHTGNGYYTYMTTTYRAAGEHAIISLPVDTPSHATCLSLYYAIAGGARLQVSFATQTTSPALVWESMEETWWRRLEVTLEAGVILVEIRGLVGVTDTEGRSGYTAVDDLHIEDTPCSNPACGPGDLQCGDGSCVERYLLCDGMPHCPNGEDEDTKECPCLPDSFRCDSGACLRHHVRCDGVNNCQDNSDEQDCKGECRLDEYPCDDGTCKHLYAWCDGHRDCQDGSDEPQNCACAEDQFRCDNACLPKFRFCDGVVDCQDGRDEVPECKCDPEYHFNCSDGTCIPKEFKCDGIAHCPDKSDQLNCTCTAAQYDCGGGRCIDNTFYCDGIPDCPGGQDESAQCECTVDQFRCAGGGCINSTFVCDGYVDCADKSDEMENCECYGGELQCDNGMCLLESKFCNGQDDCGDMSDEKSCTCEAPHFRCDNSLCINSDFRCDGNDDCGDESDETGCGCKTEEWPCTDGTQCIARELVCEGTPDCTDQSDEQNCDVCSPNQFRCHDYTCVSAVARCDGIPNCPDQSDEEGCITLEDDSGSALLGYSRGAWLPVCAEGWREGWSSDVCEELQLRAPGEVTNMTYTGTSHVLQATATSGSEFNHGDLVASAATCPSRVVVNVTCHVPECGLQKISGAAPFIVGGDIAAQGAWPWTLALQYLGNFRCGAVLLSPWWALTAAHCLLHDNGHPLTTVPQYLTLRAGTTKVRGPGVGLQTLGVESAWLHPNYTVDGAGYRWNDVALVKLAQPPVTSEFVGEVCGPQSKMLSSQVCYITGWGRTYRDRAEEAMDLREARYQPWSDKECSSIAAWGEKYKQSTQICGGYRSGVTSSCFGDSGGALLCRDGRGRWSAEGVISVGNPTCGQSRATHKPTVFSRLSSYMTWIEETMGEGR